MFLAYILWLSDVQEPALLLIFFISRNLSDWSRCGTYSLIGRSIGTLIITVSWKPWENTRSRCWHSRIIDEQTRIRVRVAYWCMCWKPVCILFCAVQILFASQHCVRCRWRMYVCLAFCERATWIAKASPFCEPYHNWVFLPTLLYLHVHFLW